MTSISPYAAEAPTARERPRHKANGEGPRCSSTSFRANGDVRLSRAAGRHAVRQRCGDSSSNLARQDGRGGPLAQLQKLILQYVSTATQRLVPAILPPRWRSACVASTATATLVDQRLQRR